jgi:hypothetical protein
MKNRLLLLILAIMFISLAFGSQLNGYGLRGGYSDTRFIVDRSDTVTSYYYTGYDAFTAGFYAEWFDDPYINAVTEIVFSRRGTVYRYDDDKPPATYYYDNYINYLSFPLYMKFSPDMKPVRPYILFGIRFDYILGYTLNNLGGSLNNKAGDFKNTMGAELGTGFDFRIPYNLRMGFEYRYSSDITYLTKTFVNNDRETAKTRSHNLLFSIGKDGLGK